MNGPVKGLNRGFSDGSDRALTGEAATATRPDPRAETRAHASFITTITERITAPRVPGMR